MTILLSSEYVIDAVNSDRRDSKSNLIYFRPILLNTPRCTAFKRKKSHKVKTVV